MPKDMTKKKVGKLVRATGELKFGGTKVRGVATRGGQSRLLRENPKSPLRAIRGRTSRYPR